MCSQRARGATMSEWTWEIDGWIVVCGALCAASAALVGNFLVLRRMSLIGDAISHAVLPGLAAAFLLTGQRQGVVMFLGASAVGVLTVFLTELARRVGKVDENASIGVVFTFLFALGLVMIVRAADHVDLDPGCVLYGALETAVLNTVAVGGMEVPRIALSLTAVLITNGLFVFGCYRQLKVSTFDAHLARSQGIPVTALHYGLAAAVAVTAVASFESVGNILVVAMFVVPPVAAWMFTDRLHVMVGLSLVLAVVSAVAGHWSAVEVPRWFGYGATNTAGMMAVAAGAVLLVAIVCAPRKGALARGGRTLMVALSILGEDVLAAMYRLAGDGTCRDADADADAGDGPRRRTDTEGDGGWLDADLVRSHLAVSAFRARCVVWWLEWKGLVATRGGRLRLTERGRKYAQNLVRAHRLWEQYLASEAGLGPEVLHAEAERLEHFTNRTLRERLQSEMDSPAVDPHGKPIPPEAS
ncbi:MAG: iron ABC transporter [Planctomycetota bacterium]|nr:MAG: iron ABC transporter [Planctomycetota bacterium]